MLSTEQYQRFARVLATNLTTTQPYHDSHFFTQASSHHPTEAHPAFGSCYDWHSAVNSSWALSRLRQLLPETDLDLAQALPVLRDKLTPENISVELAYFRANPHYERPYGWAWLAYLDSAAEPELRVALRPLSRYLLRAATQFVGDLIAPITHGVHSNTAFAMVLFLDAAAAISPADPLAPEYNRLAAVIERRARQWYLPIANWPAQLERSGHDFLSPSLSIAELLSIVLDPAEFADFFRRFLPKLTAQHPLLRPADTGGSRDAQQVHWHGLNLSRSGQLRRISASLEDAGERCGAELSQTATSLFQASVSEVTGDNYASTHWLAAFALRADASDN